MFAGNVGGKLHEQAGVAQADMQRIEDLGIIELFRGNVALA